jgi:MFS transporter, MHS family, proline/betaine transporter
MLQTAAMAAFIGINVYTCNIYFATFLIHSAAFSVHTALMIVAFGQGCVALLIPLMGMLADASSGRLLLLVGLLGAALAAPLVFMLGMMQSVQMALVAQLIYAVFNAMTSAPVFNYINTLFPARHRYTGITFSWSLSVAVFAGTAPLIAQYLVGTLEWLQGPALYVSLSAIIAGIAVLTLPSREATVASGLGLK